MSGFLGGTLGRQSYGNHSCMSRHVARLASHVSVERLTFWNRQSGPACLALATDLIVVPVLELRKTWETWQVLLVAPASKHDYYNDGARNVPQL